MQRLRCLISGKAVSSARSESLKSERAHGVSNDPSTYRPGTVPALHWIQHGSSKTPLSRCGLDECAFILRYFAEYKVPGLSSSNTPSSNSAIDGSSPQSGDFEAISREAFVTSKNDTERLDEAFRVDASRSSSVDKLGFAPSASADGFRTHATFADHQSRFDSIHSSHVSDRENSLRDSMRGLHPDFVPYMQAFMSDLECSLEFQVQAMSEALHHLSYVMVRADKHDDNLWDRFMELGLMRWIVMGLQRTAPRMRTENFDGSVEGRDNGYFFSSGSSIPSMDFASETPSRAVSNDSSIVRGANSSGERPMAPIQYRFPSSNGATPSSFGGVNVLDRQIATHIQAQVLRTLSIMIQSVSRKESLYCMFSGNFINDMISFDFEFTNEEVLMQFMSMVKTIGMRLDESLIQFFFDEKSGTFPLYTVTTRFFASSEGMVRIAVRNFTLGVYSLCSPTIRSFILRDPDGYLCSVVDRLARLCGKSARTFEYLFDDGREIRRSMSKRVGQFRQRVRMPQMIADLAEIDNIFEYLNEIVAVPDVELQSNVVSLICNRFLGPFFRPIASQSSPKAVASSKQRWSFRNAIENDNKDCEAAIPVYDACARCILLSYLINFTTAPALGEAILLELVRPSATFEDRCILNGLKAMAADLQGLERTTHAALCAIEAVVSCKLFAERILAKYGLALDLEYTGDEIHETESWGKAIADSTKSTNSVAQVLPNGSDVLSCQAVMSTRASIASDRSIRETVRSNDGSDLLVLNLENYNAPLTPTLSNAGSASFLSDMPLDFRDGNMSNMHGESQAISPAVSASEADVVKLDDEGIVMSFRLGETSLREIVSTVLLVVRTKEVRSLRVIQAVCRIIFDLGRRTSDWAFSLDVIKALLDQMASSIIEFLASNYTTIVAIETAYDNFSALSGTDSSARSSIPNLCDLLQLDSLPRFATFLPKEAGRRRYSNTSGDDGVPTVETEDASTFFVLVETFEKIVTEMMTQHGLLPSSPETDSRSLLSVVLSILQGQESSCTYQDKKQALARLAHDTLQYTARRRLVDRTVPY